jgi:hypothetical protein
MAWWIQSGVVSVLQARAACKSLSLELNAYRQHVLVCLNDDNVVIFFAVVSPTIIKLHDHAGLQELAAVLSFPGHTRQPRPRA